VGLISIILWGAGVVLMAVGAARARGPYSRWRSLKETDDNLRRYDQWRGSREAAVREVTGADVMREELRRQIRLWLGVVLAGFLLVFLGFATGP
jgi:uncharacterized membrane protein